MSSSPARSPYADFYRAAYADTLHGRLAAFDLSATAEDLVGWRSLAVQFTDRSAAEVQGDAQAK